MGMDPVTVMAAVAVAGAVGKSVAEGASANSKESALDLQGKEAQLQSQQKTFSNYQAMQKVIAAQMAHQSVTGTTFGSPSFEAIQRETYNIAGRNDENIDLESEIGQNNIKLEKDNVKTTLYAQLFGNVSDLAMGGFNAFNKAPMKGG